jgi:hypothetical protein
MLYDPCYPVLYTTNLAARNSGDASTQKNAASPERALEKQRKAAKGMINQDTTRAKDNSSTRSEGRVSSEEPTREEEQGEQGEPDAPTGGSENAGMSTILNGDLGTGVQDDADD